MAVNDVDLDQIIAAIETTHGEARPLDRVTAARAAAVRLEAFAQQVVAHFVDEARHEGASWTEIGAALGVTRQAAQQRFVPPDGVAVDAAVERSSLALSARAASALGAARELAVEHHHQSVDDIHLLLALLANRSGGAIGVLRGAGRRAADVRRAARARLHADGPRRGTKNPLLGRGVTKALDVATREALRLRSDEVGTEHLLLALASDTASPAGQALADAGVTYDDMRAAAVTLAATEAQKTTQKRKRRRRQS